MSCLDWKRGTPNAKCARRTTHALFSPFLFQFVCARPVSDWAINMLATALGSGPKSFFNASVTISGPPPPPAKVGTTATGTCGVTLVCEKPDCCNTQAKGSWAAAAANISTLAECVAKAKPCSQAAFVSFSQPQNDCSWYKACDMGHLLHPATWHGESEVIREVSPTPATPDVFALPWIRHDVGDDSLHKRGVLLVNKAEMPTVVELKAIGGQEGQGQFRTWPTNRTSVLVLDGTVDGFTVVRTTTLVHGWQPRVSLGQSVENTANHPLVLYCTQDAEPGFVPPVERMLVDGKLALGPFAVAIVRGYSYM